MAQVADERSRAIRMKLDKNELKISSSSTDAGESEDSIETAYTAEAMTIGFNSEYLLDFLKASNGGEVRLEFKDAQSAGQMRPDDANDDGFDVPLRGHADADLRAARLRSEESDTTKSSRR